MIEEYSLSNAGHICSDTGRIPIDDLNGCETAITWIQSQYAHIDTEIKVEKFEDGPSGCSVFTDVESICFNTHPSGKPNIDHRQVCKAIVKGMLANALYMK